MQWMHETACTRNNSNNSFFADCKNLVQSCIRSTASANKQNGGRVHEAPFTVVLSSISFLQNILTRIKLARSRLGELARLVD